MELVRQLIAAELLHSGFWHRFTVTAHSPVGNDPEAFGVEITGPEFAGFAWNNLTHRETRNDTDHDMFHDGLVQSMQSWLAGEGLTHPVTAWFEHDMPAASHANNYVNTLLEQPAENVESAPADGRVVWLGGQPKLDDQGFSVTAEDGELIELDLEPQDAEELVQLLSDCHPRSWPNDRPPLLKQLAYDWDDLISWREAGLVLV